MRRRELVKRVLAHSIISASSLPASMRVARLGFGPGSLFEVLFDDGRGGVFRLGSDPRSAFRRVARSALAPVVV